MPKFALALACTLLCTTALAQQKGTFTDTRDGKIYKTVKIGKQVWLAENLNYEANGSKCYKDSTAYCDKYGRLYNWKTAIKACPKDWHLPDTTEWNVLEATVGGKETASKYLKAVSGWNKNGNGEDYYGFAALPGGYCDSGGYFDDVGSYGYWWSSTEYNSFSAISRGMRYDGEYVYWLGSIKDFLLSVRCLKD